MTTLKVTAEFYQQFDADFSLEVPAEGYGGWRKAHIEIATEHTAVAVMHAWDVGTQQEFPGWHRAVEYIPRSYEIGETVFPKLLSAVRACGLKLFHVVGGGDYYKQHPGHKMALDLAGPEPEALESAESDEVLDKLKQFRADRVSPGAHNKPDIDRGQKSMGFLKQAMPLDHEGIAENEHQLFGLSKAFGINHLIYAGFAIDWCLLLSRGGMVDMSRRGLMCSAFRQAVTAVENRETARQELCKSVGLWRVSLAFGFVFDVDDFLNALRSAVPA